ncbi:undecaprenyl-phosphate glucose phosphotransferase [Derxia lacustris]|uniref:undecaprenyl-phosphate glucose phosphotransferase n=1 Tax=Derxia lacustris TaxID=764842 RepID=UPI001594E5D6|nr:undecaprenyl-phosphate glucose phosphotransferase [Derxia lacustris]
MSVEPTIVVLSLLISALLAGRHFGGAELVLAMIAFSLTFPGEVSMRKIKRGLMVSVCASWCVTFGLMLFFGWATRFIWHFDPLMLAIWFAITPVALYAAHNIIPRLTPQLLAIDGFRKSVIVAANDSGRKLARNLREEPTLGFQFMGFFDDRTGDRQPPLEEGPLLGSIDTVAEYVKKNAIEAVFIALPMAHQPRLLALLDEMKDTTASIYFVPDIFMFDLIQARIDDINGVPVLAVCETPFVGLNGIIKRISDIVLASLIILMISPILLTVAIGVKLSSRGPVIFRQRRYGLDGREIMVFKFRSMTVTENGAEVKQAQRNDKRITPFGGFLRRTSLDELPQFFNVLIGTMSIVGPRPHAVAHNEQYRKLIKGYMIRHKVKPGITGWAQVNGFRGETETLDKMQARIEYDLEYLRRWSLGFDLFIVWKTLAVFTNRTNAY